jgi:RNA polymerase sigma factor (sigma-70 family)
MPKDSIRTLSQEELINKICENRSEALTEMYKVGFPKVRTYILKNNGDEDQAKDIYQESFIVAWQQVKSGGFKPENTSSLQGFIYQVAKNKWLDWLRSSKYKKVVALGDQNFSFSHEEEIDDHEEKVNRLNTAFKGLGDNCKELLKSFYFEKASIGELAKKFGWTPQTAKNNKYRCMETLRKII